MEKRMSLIGTTCAAFKIMEGIILIVDSLAVEGPGPLQGLSYQTYNKMYEVLYGITCAVSGHLNTTETLLNVARDEWRRSTNYTHKTETTEEVVAFLFENLPEGRDFAGQVQFIVTGYDGKFAKFWVMNLINGNEEARNRVAGIGSGGAITRQFISDSGYYYEMGREDAVELAHKGIAEAGLRDPFTGGDCIKVFLIKPNGVEMLSKDKFSDLNERFYPNVAAMEE